MLDARMAALAAGDRGAWVATVDPDAPKAFRDAQGRLFDGLRSVPLESYSLEARTEVPAAGESPLWDGLKEWRTSIARRDKVQPYVVMSDAHLKGIADRRPATLSELAGCAGIGPLKLERYGEDILGVIEGSG